MENKNTSKKKTANTTQETAERVVYTEKAATALFGKEAVAKAKSTKNGNLHKAKTEKNDEFYTRLEDIEAEMMHYRQHFKDKVVFCNCDDPEWSNFFRYFALNFSFLGLKKLISTHYEPNGNSYALIVDKSLDVNGDGKIDIKDTLKVELTGNGDFRSPECIEYLKEADIVASNPPFSLFREYVDLLMEYKKKFIIIGNKNAITYKEIFKYIKANQLWIGFRNMAGGMWFYGKCVETAKPTNVKILNGVKCANVASTWFTNLTHKKRNLPLDLVGYKYSPKKYPTYDNYDAIEVSKVSDIPEDYTGVMGVPITFLDKYCPEQFDIIGCSYEYGDCGKHQPGTSWGCEIGGTPIYKRLFIRRK